MYAFFHHLYSGLQYQHELEVECHVMLSLDTVSTQNSLAEDLLPIMNITIDQSFLVTW